MPQIDDAAINEAAARAFQARFIEIVSATIKEHGFSDTLARIKKAKLPLATVTEGVIEEQPSGLYDAALQTSRGRVVLRNAERTDGTDIQVVGSVTQPLPSAEQIIALLKSSSPGTDVVCLAEFTHEFTHAQKSELLPALWKYIIANRDSNERDVLVAVGSAIRKYISLMPISNIGNLAQLLDSGTRSPLPIELEIEIAKMVFRCFESEPPESDNLYPELAARFWDIVQAYINPRVLLRDKYATATSMAIMSLVSMRSDFARAALTNLRACPYRWFREVVYDDLTSLHHAWSMKHLSATAWLKALQS